MDYENWREILRDEIGKVIFLLYASNRNLRERDDCSVIELLFFIKLTTKVFPKCLQSTTIFTNISVAVYLPFT